MLSHSLALSLPIECEKTSSVRSCLRHVYCGIVFKHVLVVEKIKKVTT